METVGAEASGQAAHPDGVADADADAVGDVAAPELTGEEHRLEDELFHHRRGQAQVGEALGVVGPEATAAASLARTGARTTFTLPDGPRALAVTPDGKRAVVVAEWSQQLLLLDLSRSLAAPLSPRAIQARKTFSRRSRRAENCRNGSTLDRDSVITCLPACPRSSAAARAADRFLASETTLLTVGGESLRATAKTNAIQLPTAILVNRQTTGAAEVLAALLQRHRVGLLIGGPTAGGLRQFGTLCLSGPA